MKHVRVIVTEVGAEVNVARVIVGETHGRVDRRTRDALRQVIESEVPEDHRPEDLEAVLDRGYWHTDQPREEYSVLVLKPERVDRVDPPIVEVHVERGMVTYVQMPESIQVRVVDYDNFAVCEDRVVRDAGGRPCVITMWGEAAADE